MISNRNIYILGEVHGAQKNIDAISYLLKTFNIKYLCLEWPPLWLKRKIQKFSVDGRISKEHVKFLHSLKRDRKVTIYAIDYPEIINWNKRDKNIADNIFSFINKLSKSTKILIVVGRLHARKLPFFIKEISTKRFIPTAYHIGDKKISIQLRYAGGTIYNFGIKRIKDTYAQKIYNSKKIKGKLILKKSRSKYYDYDLFVGPTKPCSPLQPNTSFGVK